LEREREEDEEAMTITRERLVELRALTTFKELGDYSCEVDELLDACEALLEENGRLAQENNGWARLHTHTAYREGFEACREKAALAIADLKYETVRRDPVSVIGRAMDLIRGLSPDTEAESCTAECGDVWCKHMKEPR
jgi:hypothetical protein